LIIHTIRALKDNFIYVLVDEHKRAAVIDPGSAEPVLQFLAAHDLILTDILCTHHHWDHVDGAAELAQRFPVNVWASAVDGAKISVTNKFVKEGALYTLLGEELHIVEVPGHTLGQISFWFPKLDAIFVGDTLFSCGCGRLFEGTYEQLFTSLKKFTKLPLSTQIYFGHEYTLRNIQFLQDQGANTPELQKYREDCETKVAQKNDTTPVSLALEVRLNPFLKARSIDELRSWREARNSWNG
jgi:hydroxyacylglutathione hydrolase